MMKKTRMIAAAVLLAFCGGLLPADGTAPLSAASEEAAVLGDFDDNGRFSVEDTQLLQQWIIGNEVITNLSNVFNFEDSDMNGDGEINAFDLALAKRKLLEPYTKYTLEYSIVNEEVCITGITKTADGEVYNVSIPKRLEGYPVTSIAEKAFYQTDITAVYIPDTVVSLGDDSFAECQSLKTVYLSRNLETDLSGSNLFYNSYAIETVHTSADMLDTDFIEHFKYHPDTNITGVLKGELYDLSYQISTADNTVAITGYQPSDATDICVTIPEEILGRTVTTIKKRAFTNSDICEVILPNTLTTIESWAFGQCKNLRKLTLSPNLISDPEQTNAFTLCNALTEVIVPENMIDPTYLEELLNSPWGNEYFKELIDDSVDEVYNALKAANPDIDWNIADAEGQARENAKYEVAKYIHSQLAGNLIIYDDTYRHHTSAYSLVKGRGACAGMSRSYILLLLKAGFTEEEVQLIRKPMHALAGIQLYGQWYFVECTSAASGYFGMTYQNEWYRGAEEGAYNGYYDASAPYVYYYDNPFEDYNDAESEAYLAERYGSHYTRGDMNMDGVTDSADYALLEGYLGGAAADFNLVNADVNYDRDINETDLTVLNSIIIGETDLLSIIVPIYGEPIC